MRIINYSLRLRAIKMLCFGSTFFLVVIIWLVRELGIMGFYQKRDNFVIMSDDVLSYEKYVQYVQYGYNYGCWYVSNYGKSERAVIDKLKEKGFVDSNVNVFSVDDVVVECNLLREVIDKLKDTYVLDDNSLIEIKVDSMLDAGKSLLYIRRNLSSKGFSMVDVQRYIDSLDSDDVEFEGLDKEALKIVHSSKFEKLSNDYEKRGIIYKRLAYRGFSYSLISRWLSENGF